MGPIVCTPRIWTKNWPGVGIFCVQTSHMSPIFHMAGDFTKKKENAYTSWYVTSWNLGYQRMYNCFCLFFCLFFVLFLCFVLFLFPPPPFFFKLEYIYHIWSLGLDRALAYLVLLHNVFAQMVNIFSCVLLYIAYVEENKNYINYYVYG